MTPIPGWPGYLITRRGTVYSCWRQGGGSVESPRRMVTKVDKDGYSVVYLRVATNRYRTVGVHNLLLRAFVGPPPTPAHQACHNDGSKRNNALSNLRWGRPKENQQDRVLHGTDVRGEKQGAAKLSNAQVRRIRKEHTAGATQAYLSRKYEISTTQMNRIVRNLSRRNG